MLGVFADFERVTIVERVKAGLARAQVKGKRLGRPKVPSPTEAAIHRLRAEGLGIRTIAKRVGCDVGTAQRVVGSGCDGSVNLPIGRLTSSGTAHAALKLP